MKLPPFFKYFGSKNRSGALYPEPTHDRIIEPFAGGAGYAMNYPEHDVLLCDTDERVIKVWKYLIGASEDEIMDLPLLEVGQNVRSLNLPIGPQLFISCCINTSPFRNVLSSWSNDVHSSLWSAGWRERVAKHVKHIRHWEALCCDYGHLENHKATWFIDPPYRTLQEHYDASKKRPIDYAHLGQWCKSRQGQVIVCEQDGAKWLPFQRLGTFKAVRGPRTCEEAIWTNDGCAYAPEPTAKPLGQVGLFGT